MKFNKFGIKSNNISLMYFRNVIRGLVFFLPIIALYFEKDLFSITNVAIIFAVGGISLAIFEIPTGAIADLFGRKKTLLSSSFLLLISLIFLYIGGNMLMFILYAVISAFADALSSGTDSAIIYDTLKAEKKEKYYKKIIGKYFALWPIGATVGSLIGGYLASISLSSPVLFTFIPQSIAFILLFFLKEPKYEKETHKNVIKHVFESSKIVIKNNQLIILLIGSFIIWGMSESTHRLNSLFFQFKDIPIIYFGYISAFIFGFSALGHYFSHDISKKLGNKTTLIISVIGTPLLILIATLTTKYTSAIFLAISSIFFGLRNPIVDYLLNREVSSNKRATIISTNSFMERLGIAIFAPFIGYIAELYTINTAFKISTILMFILPLLFLFLKDKD